MLSIILSCDPLVGDTACQIRAIHLLYLYQLYNKGQVLSAEDLQYIRECQMLTLLTEAKLLEFNIIDTEAICLKKINLAPELFANYTVNGKFIAKAQANVALRALMFLQIICKPHFFEEGLDKYLQVGFLYKSSSQQHIPLIPCFISTQLMLHYLKYTQALLIINMQRIVVNSLGSKECLWRS